MRKNVLIRRVVRSLQSVYDIESITPDSVFIVDKLLNQVIAQVTVSSANNESLLLGISVSYSNGFAVADITNTLMHIAHVDISEPFYLSATNFQTFGAEAYDRAALEANSTFLKSVPPINGHIH